jgi:hypothetical protein
MSRWTALTDYLRGRDEYDVVLSLTEIERILGAPLPASARRHPAFWSNSEKNPYSRAWRSAGFVVSRAGLGPDRVGFLRQRRVDTPEPPPLPPSETDIILVGCVSTKCPTPAPARDLYVSALFDRRRAYAEAADKPWLILSALYGVVDPHEVIEPYDVSLKEMSYRERREWALQVVAQLRDRLGALAGTDFELHAGAAYAHPLVDLLSSAGARVARPIEGLRIGEQLQWYDRPGVRPAHDLGPRPSVMGLDRQVSQPTSDRPAPGLARAITEAFNRGALDFSSRRGAPTPGWVSMPEVSCVEELRTAGATDAQIRLFITFISAMDRARDADRLWFAGRDLFLAEPWSYDPTQVATRSFTDLGDALMTHRVSQRHLPDSAAWRRIAESLLDRRSVPEIHRAIHDGAGDARRLLDELDSVSPAGSALFPFLSGPKIGPMWVRILAYPGRAKITSLEILPVAVDVQVRKVTEFLGVTDTYGKQLELARPEIQAAWRGDVEEHGAEGPEPLRGTCAALDPALWFYGKWGCTICVAARRQMPIAPACDGCRMEALTARA